MSQRFAATLFPTSNLAFMRVRELFLASVGRLISLSFGAGVLRKMKIAARSLNEFQERESVCDHCAR
jgi:hypothetical protein